MRPCGGRSASGSLWPDWPPPLLRARAGAAAAEVERRLYVAEPGIRNYLEYGGHGLLVFDIDHGHKFVKRIPTAGLDEKGVPINVKGICASARTRKLYISTIKQLMCIDLVTEKLVWERTYPEGCDRMALSPDGRMLYVPSFEGAIWNVVDAATGDVIAKVTPNSGAHNTIYGLDGTEVYLAGLKSPILTIASTKDHTIARTVGPFSNRIRPFTVNGRQTLCLRELQRAARLRGRRPEDGQDAAPGRGRRAFKRGRSSATAARATASA